MCVRGMCRVWDGIPRPARRWEIAQPVLLTLQHVQVAIFAELYARIATAPRHGQLAGPYKIKIFFEAHRMANRRPTLPPFK